GSFSKASTIPVVIVIIALEHLVTPSVHHYQFPALVLQQVLDDEAVVQSVTIRGEHVRNVQRRINRNRIGIVLIAWFVRIRVAVRAPNRDTIGDGSRGRFSHIGSDTHGYRSTYPHNTGSG